MNKRLIYGIATLILLGIEILIGMFAHGWIRSYFGDVLVVILLYTLFRTISPAKPSKWFVLPTIILVFAFGVEFLQLWGFCDRFGITNNLLRIMIGTGYSNIDLICYVIGILPCYLIELILHLRSGHSKDTQDQCSENENSSYYHNHDLDNPNDQHNQ